LGRPNGEPASDVDLASRSWLVIETASTRRVAGGMEKVGAYHHTPPAPAAR
jgi:hypothetical protein